MRITLVLFIFLPFVSFAQSVGIKDIPVDETTTIEVKKGGSASREFEVVSSENDIEGDAAPLLKEARNNWKKSCADWKQEVKDLNKENHVISMSCGAMECATVAMESTCRSKAQAKIKVRVK